MSAGAWTAAVGLVCFAAGAAVAWWMRGGSVNLDRLVGLGEVEDRLIRLVRSLGATVEDLAALDRGVLVADVADAIRARGKP